MIASSTSKPISMYILHSRLDGPQQVSTDECGSSLSLPKPLFQSKNYLNENDNLTSTTSSEVLACLKEFVCGSVESTNNLRTGQTEIEISCNEHYIVTYRVEICHLGDEEMDDKLKEHFPQNTMNPEKKPRVKDEEAGPSKVHKGGSNNTSVISSQSGDRRNPDEEKHPGGHYNGSSSLNNNKKGNNNEDDGGNGDEDEDEEEEDRRMSSPYSSKGQYEEILRRKNKAVLIVNLYPPARGYTYCCYVRELEGNDPKEIQVFKESHEIPYSESYILDCIDQEIVPLKLIDKLEKVDGVNLMRYLGCVVCEIRDYRRFSTNLSKRNLPVVKKVLLKPTNHTLFNELEQLIADSIEDRNLYKRLSLENGDISSARREQDCNSAESQREEKEDENGGEPPAKRKKVENSASASGENAPDPTDDDKLSLRQRLEIEKQLLLKTYSGLCLDPSKTVGLIANARQFERYKWNSPQFRDTIKSKFNQVKQPRSQNIQQLQLKPTPTPIDKRPDYKEWETLFGKVHQYNDLTQFLQFTKNLSKKKAAEREQAEKANVIDVLKLPPINYLDYPPMATPTNLEELVKIGRPAERAVHRPIVTENYIRKVDEYTLETERKKRPHLTKLSIYQRNGTESYFGELEQESFADWPEPSSSSRTMHNDVVIPHQNSDSKSQDLFPSTKCRFELGSLRHVQLYVRQFTDIFTEDGRRPCKITYQKVGNPNPHIMFINDYVSQSRNSANTPDAAAVNNNNVMNYKPHLLGPVKSTTVAPTPVQSCAPPVVSNANSTPLPISVSASGASTVVVSSTSPASNTSTQPPVQIVHPQPRSIQQATTLTAAPQIHYSTAAAPQTATILQSPQPTIQATAGGTNVNLNLNLNSARVVHHQQPLLTRPQIINVNVHQQQQQSNANVVVTSSAAATATANYSVPKIQTSAQPHLQQQLKLPPVSSMANANNSLRMKQPTLATLLMAPTPVTKPITVIQPQPQNPNPTLQLGSANPSMDYQKQQQQHNLQQISQIVHQSQQQQQQSQQLQSQQQASSQPQQQPIMIITNAGTHQQHNGSVSLNLNTISLDSLLHASQQHQQLQQQNYVTTASLISQSGSNLSTLNGLNTILRFSNNTNTLTLTPQQQQILRQNALALNMGHANNSGATLLNPGIIINSAAPTSVNHQQVQLNNSNLAGNRATISASIGPTPQSKCSDIVQGGMEEQLNVPDLHSLLNSTPTATNTGFRSQTGGATATIDGLNLDLNLNLNLNLGGAPPAQSPIASTSLVNHQNQNQAMYDAGGNHTHTLHQADGVDSLFNVINDVIGSDLGNKLDGGSSMRQGGGGTNNNNNNMKMNTVTSSLSPNKPIQQNSGGTITLNDLLGSPPIIVSSTTQQQQANGHGLSPMHQSPQSPSITSILSPVPSNITTNPNQTPYSTTTPRLSALLAGTPSADSSGGLSTTNRFDPSGVGGIGGRGLGGTPTSTSYGNLLDRLVASSGQSSPITQRTGGSRLNPIASATPMLASSLGGAPLNARPGGQVGLARPTAYRQIAPAPPPNRQPQPQQLINVIGYVGGNTNSNTGTGSATAQGQPTTIRVVNNPPQGSSGNLGNR